VLFVRRRSYGIETEDPWLLESIIEWGWRAAEIAHGWMPNDQAIAARIAHERIR
jgi:hypothetical protein